MKIVNFSFWNIFIFIIYCSKVYTRSVPSTPPFYTIRGPSILGIPFPLEIIPNGSDRGFDRQTTSDEVSFFLKYPFQYLLNPTVRTSIGTLNTVERFGEKIPFGRQLFIPLFRAASQPASFNFERPIEM